MQSQIEIIHTRTGKHILVSANRAASLIRRGRYTSVPPRKPKKSEHKAAAKYDRKDMQAEED